MWDDAWKRERTSKYLVCITAAKVIVAIKSPHAETISLRQPQPKTMKNSELEKGNLTS
jgi:hypothetical protein